jgi:hypothetical protein
MKLEDQVCSLENAKKLAELGVTAESLFVHYEIGNNVALRCMCTIPSFILAPAYTVAELGEMLPANKHDRHAEYSKTKKGWFVGWYSDDYGCGALTHDYSNELQSEADARALMLIWLIENKHIEGEVAS